jgi:hypothetical protein
MSHLPLFAQNRKRSNVWFWHGTALLVAALAFYLRLRYLTLFRYDMDEFFTLAAANFIAQSGWPRYPTGLFYDPGLPFSYIDGVLFWLFGFSEALGRWPAVIFGVLAVVTTYWLGTRLLRSQAVGVLAALWLALSLESVEWGGRARMISLAQWLGLLAVALLWLGLSRASSRHRLGFAISYAVSLLSHFAMVVLMPAWFVAAGLLWRLKLIRLQGELVRDTLFLGLVFGLAISSGVIFQPPPSVEFQTSGAGLEAKTGELGDKFLQIPSDIGHAWETYGPYFFELPHGPILIATAIGLLVSLARFMTGHRIPPDSGALFLAALFVTVLLVLGLTIDPHWQRARYLVMQVQAIFLLLGAHGCREVVLWLNDRVFGPQKARGGFGNPPFWSVAGAVVLGLALSSPFLPPLADIIEGGGNGWLRYDQAFAYIRETATDDEKIITMHPPASLLYLSRSDYYLVQSSPKLIVRPDGALGDRYSGAIWLETAEEFNRLVAGSPKIWFVVEEFWLFNSYDGYLQQQILQQMDKLWGEGGVWALASRPGRWPLARQAEVSLNAEFQGGGRLLGFTAQPGKLKPGSAIYLTFFWQGAIPYGAKILVHLRDENNNTVAQADHFVYDGKVPSARWPSLLENDSAIRDGAALILPPDLKPGTYRLLIGFYHPETFERLGVINDQSGESAVVLGEWQYEPD